MSDDHIKYICIGHCCHDLEENGYVLGGSAAYSAAVAKGLGAQSKIISAYGSDFLFQDQLLNQGIELANVGSDQTTVFENIYGEGARQQVIHSRADVIGAEKIFLHLNQPDIVHLCPIADEIDYKVVKDLDCGLLGATIQGSMRCWDATGKVYPCKMEYSILEGIDVVIISDEDVLGIEDALKHVIEMVPLVVMTQGKKGAELFIGGTSVFIPSFKIIQKQETGAGDTFAAAFFMQYHQSRDPVESCIYAHAVSSIVLEREAGDTFPNEHEIVKRVVQY